MKIGLISDTHGLLRPEALAALEGCEWIVHAGDIGKPEILDALRRLAPVAAVRGNNDHGEWADALPHEAELELGGLRLHVVHQPEHLPTDLVARGVRVAVCGHSHKPRIDERDGMLLVNPGSAGPRRFRLPIAVGLLHIEGTEVRAELIELS
ncbi:metallophosphoesterase family protein [Azorhizophilus paspali]|uniref:Phosphoesterase n=1 Tax=Azorhizophilus paspali TaxID=69963 RepID=A0ABV6SLF5_AZOPA